MGRRTFDRFVLALVASLALGCTVSAEAAPTRADRPNIIVIFADDLGWKEVAYQGTDFYETPNIDRLAAGGMVFSAGYASSGNRDIHPRKIKRRTDK